MKKIFAIISIVLASASFGIAQNVLDGAYVHETSPTLKPVPFAFLREADVMWSKKVWRVIDLGEKINLPLKYPLAKDTKDRKSLMETVYEAIKEGTLTAYNSLDDEFTQRMTIEEVERAGGAGVDTIQVIDPNPPYMSRDSVVKREFKVDDVVAYRIKEEWFFDKQRSVIDVRIIGIAPMIYDKDEFGNIREGGVRKPIFWIYFPEARNILVNAEVYNRGNDAERRTFDEIFMKRLFNSYIMKESNVYNRRISDYRVGLDALLESERIKTDIINLEHDLWEY